MDLKNDCYITQTNRKNNPINQQRVNNSPVFYNRKFVKCFYIKENIFNTEKIDDKINKSKSNKNGNNRSKSHKNKSNNFETKKVHEKINKINSILEYSNKINKKITFQHKQTQKIIKYKLIRNIGNKEKRLTNTCIYNNITTTETRETSNRKKKNYVCKINLDLNKNKLKVNNYKKNRNKNLIYFSLDNILSKAKTNKNKTKVKANSFDKNKNISINKTPKLKLKHMENKLKTKKVKKNTKYRNKIKSDNSGKAPCSNKTNTHFKYYNKLERKTEIVRNSYGKNKLNLNYKSDNSNNNSKLFSGNTSTNYKSLNSRKIIKSNKKDKKLTPDINKNKKTKKYININSYKNKEKVSDDNCFKEFDFVKENDIDEKINGIKINNFGVNKPKEMNMKFTLFKEEKESDLSVSRASKVIIGKIDGYKDIIETDKKNNYINLNSNLYYNKNLNKLNILNCINNSCTNSNKKINKNFSNSLKNENDSITFNMDEFCENLNISNLDGMSSTNTNNKFTIKKKIERNKYNYNNDSDYLKIEKKLQNENNGSLNSIYSYLNSNKNKKDLFKKKKNNNEINVGEYEKYETRNAQFSDNCYII